MKVFVTGASGYIGGTVAARLIQAGHTVAGLTRDHAKAENLARLGIQPVVGTLDDTPVLAEEAHRADAVVNAADSDHRGAVETLIAALAGSGKPLIHTSGSSLVADDARGEATDTIFSEDILDTSSLWQPDHPVRQTRVAIDRLVLAAGEQGIRSAVLCNSLIYGHGRGLARDSIQLPALVRQARSEGAVRHVGRGRNIWSTVHVDDMADLYLLALEGTPPGAFYFVENGEESFAAMTSAIARALHLPGPEPWDLESDATVIHPQLAIHALGSNSRVRTTRAHDLLGWAPRNQPVTDWIESTDFGEAASPERFIRR